MTSSRLALSPRDRRVLAVGAVVLVAILAWALGWAPLIASRDALRKEVVANAATLAWMRHAVTRMEAIGTGATASVAGDRSLLARVDAGARQAGLGGSLVEIEPRDTRHVRVRLAGADFDVMATWLEQTAAHGIAIEALSVQRASGAGRVDAQVSLREGGP